MDDYDYVINTILFTKTCSKSDSTWVLFCLFLSWMEVICQTYFFANMFYHFVACPSTFLIVSYKEQRFYILMNSNIFLTFFIVHDFCVLQKNLCLIHYLLLNFSQIKDDIFFLPQMNIQIVSALFIERLSFVELPWHLYQNQLTTHAWVFLRTSFTVSMIYLPSFTPIPN